MDGLDVLADETALLLASVESLDIEDLAHPSNLPDWTRGHVLAHIAGNAEGLGRRARSMSDAVPRSMYESLESRSGDIAWRSRRTVAQHAQALASTQADFAYDLAGIPADRAGDDMEIRLGLMVRIGDLPLLRLQEICVHHADLGVSTYDWSNWPPALVAWMLPRITASFAAREGFPVGWVEVEGARISVGPDPTTGVSGGATEVVAWLVGRAPGSGLAVTGVDAVPVPPAWL
ncbi:MAG: maleylpyruvate isomerase family mycothiol-dependent enzyme [Actinobacteria bacterium]|nr:maleylpyruvate isomerase family mycothiol-dependent enzyme [Actinomycetota bacterium]